MRYDHILALIALLVLGVSCKQYEDMPEGDQYPSTVISRSTQDLQDLLCSSEQGWLLTLMPDGGRYGGRAIVVKFKDSYAVTMRSEDDETELNSTYHFSQNGGIRLTFDTYNYRLHRYSDPYWGLPDSYNGDSDFIIQQISSDQRTITVRGGRTGAIQTLVRLDKDPATYLQQVKAMRKALQGQALAPLKLGGTEVALSIFGFAHKLWVRYGDKKELIPITFSDRGLRLLEPLTIGGETLSELVLNEDKSAMQTVDGKQTLKLFRGRYDFTRDYVITRFINSADTTGTSAYAVFNQLSQIQSNTYYPGTFDSNVYLGRSSDWMPSIGLYIDLSPSFYQFSHYYLDYTAVYGEPLQFHVTRIIQDGMPWFYVHDALDTFIESLVSHGPYKFDPFKDGQEHSFIRSIADPDNYWMMAMPPVSFAQD